MVIGLSFEICHLEFYQSMAHEDLIKAIESMSVLELSELVKALEEKFGVSAAMMTAPATGAGQVVIEEGGVVEEKDSFNVVLKDVGSQKIQVIKVIREVTGLGLKESKDKTEQVPAVIKEGLKKEDAEALKKQLEDAGASIELK